MLLTIYNLYRHTSDFSLSCLSACLMDIGVVESPQSSLISSLVNKRLISNQKHISLD